MPDGLRSLVGDCAAAHWVWELHACAVELRSTMGRGRGELCVPLVLIIADRLPEAAHELAFVLDQVMVADCPSVTVAGDTEMVTLGTGGGGGLEELPPPHAGASAVTHSTQKTDIRRNQLPCIKLAPVLMAHRIRAAWRSQAHRRS